jgi:hypothetical protein
MQKRKAPKFESWTDPPITKNKQLESRSNVWPIGLVIYLLMTLDYIQKWLNEADDINEEDFIRLGRHLVGPIRTEKQPEYSQGLRDLVRGCLNPSIELRPTASRLVNRTRAGMESFRTASRTGRDNTKAPPLRHLNRSKSALPAGQAPKARQAQLQTTAFPAIGPAAPSPGANPGPSTWEPRQRVDRQPLQSQKAPPIQISDDEEIFPTYAIPENKNEPRRKRRHVATNKKGPPDNKRKLTNNIAGEVVVISDEAPTAVQNQLHNDVAGAGDGYHKHGSRCSKVRSITVGSSSNAAADGSNAEDRAEDRVPSDRDDRGCPSRAPSPDCSHESHTLTPVNCESR